MAGVSTDKIISTGSWRYVSGKTFNAKYLVLIKTVSSATSVLAQIGIHVAFFLALDDP